MHPHREPFALRPAEIGQLPGPGSASDGPAPAIRPSGTMRRMKKISRAPSWHESRGGEIEKRSIAAARLRRPAPENNGTTSADGIRTADPICKKRLTSDRRTLSESLAEKCRNGQVKDSKSFSAQTGSHHRFSSSSLSVACCSTGAVRNVRPMRRNSAIHLWRRVTSPSGNPEQRTAASFRTSSRDPLPH